METLQTIMGRNSNHEYTCHDLVKGLCDIYSKPHDENSLTRLFDEIAVGLLRQSKIVTPNEHFFIREIEFYFYNQEFHPDPFAHSFTNKENRQKHFGEWYFHRYKDLKPFLNCTWNGVDITFGDEQHGSFGGILIRKIQNAITGDQIKGINRVVRALIKNIGEDNTGAMNDLALGFGQKVFNKNQLLHLEVANNNFSVPIYKTQRNNLGKKKTEGTEKFLELSYCYYNHDLEKFQKKEFVR